MDLKPLKYLVLILPILGQAWLAVRFIFRDDFIGTAISLLTLNIMIIFVYKTISDGRV